MLIKLEMVYVVINYFQMLNSILILVMVAITKSHLCITVAIFSAMYKLNNFKRKSNQAILLVRHDFSNVNDRMLLSTQSKEKSLEHLDEKK